VEEQGRIPLLFVTWVTLWKAEKLRAKADDMKSACMNALDRK